MYVKWKRQDWDHKTCHDAITYEEVTHPRVNEQKHFAFSFVGINLHKQMYAPLLTAFGNHCVCMACGKF